MARRKRLSPVSGAPSTAPAPPPRSAPIAQVAGDAAAAAAFHDIADELGRARAEGRLVVEVPLEAIDAHHLIRDRLAADDEAQAALVASLAARGQQVPLELVALAEGRFGLVSGWRRLTALRSLGAATALAVIRRPDTAAAAYVAMVEENEIRSDLSFFERARLVRRAVEAGVYADDRAALAGLFGATTKVRRSKIKSFLRVVDALEGVLRHPTRLSEHLGLKLAKALAEDPGTGARVAAALEGLDPGDAAAEIAALTRVVAVSHAKPASPRAPAPAAGGTARSPCAGITLHHVPGRITLAGPGVDAALARRLEAWLAEG